MNRAETLLPLALALDESERIDLALRLLESVEGAESDTERAWVPVVAARVQALRAGTARTRPMADAIDDIRARLLAGRRA